MIVDLLACHYRLNRDIQIQHCMQRVQVQLHKGLARQGDRVAIPIFCSLDSLNSFATVDRNLVYTFPWSRNLA